jgi:hypothetical protein
MSEDENRAARPVVDATPGRGGTVTLARSISGGKVLCLLSTSDTHPHPIVRALAEAGADVEIVGDVYRGLARWGSKSRSAFAAVVVDVDRLDASEMEFFDLATRYRWNVPTLVFARSAGSPKLQEALLRGARAAVDPESVLQQVWRGLEPAQVSESEPEKAAVEPAPPAHAIDHDLERRLAAAVNSQDQGVERIDVGLADGTRAFGDEPEAATEELAEPEAEREPERSRGLGAERVSPDNDVGGKERSVRVPWRRYADRPQRKPPPRTAPPPTAADTVGGEEPPLLTPEELDALIGGRFSPAAGHDDRRTESDPPEEES